MIELKKIMACFLIFFTGTSVVYCQAVYSDGKGITLHSSEKYFQKNEQPFFFIGYSDWAPVVKEETWNSGVSLKGLIDLAAQYDLNYIRISLGLTNYGVEYSSIPFKRMNGQVDRVDLDKWDDDYWSVKKGLPWHAKYASGKGVNLHIAIFFGNGFENKAAWSWPHNYWNKDNQTRDFYGNLNRDGDAGIDEMGEFYRVSDFVNNTGVGFYQRKLINKVIAEMSPFDNIFYEVCNECMDGNAEWNYEVIKYIKSQTGRVITINQNPPQHNDNNPINDQGYSVHVIEPIGRWEGGHDTGIEIKNWVESHVGEGVPVWYTPDGPDLALGHAHENRRAAWYSLVGGAAGYGGFQSDIRNGRPDTEKLKYYRNLMNFLSATDVPFWTMTPRQSLIGNSPENSLLAKAGEYYLAYILNDETVIIRLPSGIYHYKTYNPKSGKFSREYSIKSWKGEDKLFRRSDGEDWVIYVYQ